MGKVVAKKVLTAKSRRSERSKADPIPTRKLTELAKASEAHKWLRDPEQDIYSENDGKPASWPTKRTKGAA